MAGAAASLAPDPNAGPLAPSAPKPLDTGAPSLDDTEKRVKDFTSQNKILSGQLSAIAADTKQKNDKLEAKLDLEKPPQFQTIPYEAPKQTSPIEQWSSMAMIFAMLGSAFTRTPMTTALNAGAAVLNGYKAKDLEATEHAMKQWEAANKNALEAANYQQNAYKNIVASYERRESNNTAAGAAQERAVQAQITALANAFKDDNMLALGQQRGVQAQLNEIDRRQEQDQKMQVAFEKAQMMGQQKLVNAKIQMTPEFQAAAARGDGMEMQRLIAAGGDPKAVANYAKMQAKQTLDNAKIATKKEDSESRNAATQDYIDKSLDLIPELGRGGVSQMVEKGKERIGNALGVNMENPAQQYDAYMDSIKMQILAEKEASGHGTQNQDYRKALDQLLPKINHWEGSTGEETTLKILANTLNRVHGLPDRFDDVSAQTPKVPAWEAPQSQPQQGGLQNMSTAGGSAAAPAIQVEAGTPITDDEKKTAKPISTREELQNAPPGVYYNPATQKYIRKSGQ